MDERRATADPHLQEVAYQFRNSAQLTLSLVRKRAEGSRHPETCRELRDLELRLAALWTAATQGLPPSGGERADMKALIAERLAALRISLGRSDVDAVAEGDALAFPSAVAVPLSLALNEYLLNCFQHAFPERPGRIAVRLERTSDGAAVISLADDGVGMTPPAKANGSRGLHLAQLLLAQVGASVAIDSRPGRGTTVTLRLPIPGEAVSPAPAP